MTFGVSLTLKTDKVFDLCFYESIFNTCFSLESKHAENVLRNFVFRLFYRTIEVKLVLLLQIFYEKY